MVRIKSIAKKQIDKERLYNLAVENDESFVANGVVVHNCRSILVYITEVDRQFDKISPDEPISSEQLRALNDASRGNFIPEISAPASGVFSDYEAAYKASIDAVKKMDAEADNAIDRFLYGGYFEMNAALRGDAEVLSDLAKSSVGGSSMQALMARADGVSKALTYLPAYKGTLYRGAGDLTTEALGASLTENTVLTMKSFTFASYDYNIAYRFGGKTLFYIQAKNARVIGVKTLHPNEKELLFDKNTQFLVKKISKKASPSTGENTYHVFLEEL